VKIHQLLPESPINASKIFFIALGSLENPITGAHLWPLRQGLHFALKPKQRDILDLPGSEEKITK